MGCTAAAYAAVGCKLAFVVVVVVKVGIAALVAAVVGSSKVASKTSEEVAGCIGLLSMAVEVAVVGMPVSIVNAVEHTFHLGEECNLEEAS